MKISGSDNVDEWSDDGGERIYLSPQQGVCMSTDVPV